MAGFWTRTRRFVALLVMSTVVLELAAFELFRRTNDSWVLLLAVAILVIPIVAAGMASTWLGRPKRKRWKRHDLEAAVRAGRDPAEVRAELSTPPPAP
jgi:type VI protein secretion system component VasK